MSVCQMKPPSAFLLVCYLSSTALQSRFSASFPTHSASFFATNQISDTNLRMSSTSQPKDFSNYNTNAEDALRLNIFLSSGPMAFSKHVGFLDAVDDLVRDEKGRTMVVESIVGVSSGSVTGALYAAGYPTNEIYRILTRSPPIRHIRPSLRLWKGLFNSKPFLQRLRRLLPPTFEDLRVPFGVGVVNAETGEYELITRGELAEAIVASCSIPVLFQPTKLIPLGDDDPVVKLPRRLRHLQRRVRYYDGGVVDRTGMVPWSWWAAQKFQPATSTTTTSAYLEDNGSAYSTDENTDTQATLAITVPESSSNSSSSSSDENHNGTDTATTTLLTDSTGTTEADSATGNDGTSPSSAAGEDGGDKAEDGGGSFRRCSRIALVHLLDSSKGDRLRDGLLPSSNFVDVSNGYSSSYSYRNSNGNGFSSGDNNGNGDSSGDGDDSKGGVSPSPSPSPEFVSAYQEYVSLSFCADPIAAATDINASLMPLLVTRNTPSDASLWSLGDKDEERMVSFKHTMKSFRLGNKYNIFN